MWIYVFTVHVDACLYAYSQHAEVYVQYIQYIYSLYFFFSLYSVSFQLVSVMMIRMPVFPKGANFAPKPEIRQSYHSLSFTRILSFSFTHTCEHTHTHTQTRLYTHACTWELWHVSGVGDCATHLWMLQSCFPPVCALSLSHTVLGINDFSAAHQQQKTRGEKT